MTRATQATTETTNIPRPGGLQLSEGDPGLPNENSVNSRSLRDSIFDNDLGEDFEKVERYESAPHTPHLGDYIPPTIPRGDRQLRESSTGYLPPYGEQISVEQFAQRLHLSEEPLDSPTYWDTPEFEGDNQASSSSHRNPTKNLPSYRDVPEFEGDNQASSSSYGNPTKNLLSSRDVPESEADNRASSFSYGNPTKNLPSSRDVPKFEGDNRESSSSYGNPTKNLPPYRDIPEFEGDNRAPSSSYGNPKNLPSYRDPYRDQSISSNSERGGERGRAFSTMGTVKFLKEKAKQWQASLPAPPLPDVLIAIMGKTGTGKTSFINAATAGSLLVGHSLQACTQKIQTAETEINGRKVIFIDTPGFDDTNRSDVDILGEITAYLQTSNSNDIKLSGVIYLHKITDTRMEGSTMKNIRMFKKLCGEGNFHNVILCTTGWDLVDPALGEEREQELGETENFWGTMMKKGARIRRHDRKSLTSAIEIAKELVGASPVTLQIQKELMESPLLAETSAGKLILEEMEKLKIEHQKEMQALREDIEEARRSNSQDEIIEMRKEYEKEIQGLRKAQEELQKLRSADQIAMQKMIDDLKAELSNTRGGRCVIC